MAKHNGQQQPILIAGGGIGGLAAAYALARKGFPVRVLEKRNPGYIQLRSYSGGSPAIARGSPVSSRICKPVFARSTT